MRTRKLDLIVLDFESISLFQIIDFYACVKKNHNQHITVETNEIQLGLVFCLQRNNVAQSCMHIICVSLRKCQAMMTKDDVQRPCGLCVCSNVQTLTDLVNFYM